MPLTENPRVLSSCRPMYTIGGSLSESRDTAIHGGEVNTNILCVNGVVITTVYCTGGLFTLRLNNVNRVTTILKSINILYHFLDTSWTV